MTIWEAIVLGIIQGATEFLPVSSSGHLVLGQELLGVNPAGVTFEVALHLGTLLSIVLVYRKRLMALVRGALAGEPGSWRYIGLLALASVPAAIVGVFFGDRVGALFDSPAVVGWAFLVTGLFLWSTRVPLRRGGATDATGATSAPGPTGEPGVAAAAGMGIAQAFALVPGISRSGSTVTTGLWMGIDPQEAAAFSFLMSIPAILGAALLEFGALEGGVGSLQMTAGTVAAAVTGIVAIKTFVAMLKQRSFHRFAYYLWPLGVLFLWMLSRG